jgi:hypothetical protein
MLILPLIMPPRLSAAGNCIRPDVPMQAIPYDPLADCTAARCSISTLFPQRGHRGTPALHLVTVWSMPMKPITPTFAASVRNIVFPVYKRVYQAYLSNPHMHRRLPMRTISVGREPFSPCRNALPFALLALCFSDAFFVHPFSF